MASDGHRGIEPPLLTTSDPSPVTIVNPAGRSPFLLIGDHAGNVIPSSLETLGLSETDRCRHIAWDIGVGGLGVALAEGLDAVFIRQTYSRLVIDCNRKPDAIDAVAATSDGTIIPGNVGVKPDDRAARVEIIHESYHRAIAEELARRDAEGRATVLVSLHSFTPALAGQDARPWHVGVLHHGGDPSFAVELLAALRREPNLTVGDNEPYRMDQIDYTIPRHAYPALRPYAELEIRQNLLGDEPGQHHWALLLMRVLETCPTAYLKPQDNPVSV